MGSGAFAKGCSVSVRPEQELGLHCRQRSQGPEGVRFGNHRISSLLFADDVVLMASSGQDLQHVLERFAAECEAAGMRISTSKSEAMVLDRKRVACPLQVGGEVLPQVEEFKYLGVLFTSEGKMEREIDRRIGAASAVMRSVYRTVVVKKELNRGYKRRNEFPPLGVAGRSLRDRGEKLRSLGRSFESRAAAPSHREESAEVARASVSDAPGRLPREVFQACPTGEEASGEDPGHAWRDYVSRLAELKGS
ncbi:hypothetical protein L3Q82_024573 [Scortum barcoo]|uniref:Uncharacterized protein n=1 Tax=Scortum barcoo TaxID=214431 RepID=A0ACB8WP53_9TELE|nr:hypothetical protein L3Q82_024573 [Scortum barcoo]